MDKFFIFYVKLKKQLLHINTRCPERLVHYSDARVDDLSIYNVGFRKLGNIPTRRQPGSAQRRIIRSKRKYHAANSMISKELIP